MFHIIYVVLMGFTIGQIAKLIHPGEEPEGFWATTAVGVFGSVLGHLVASLFGCHESIFFSVAGGIGVCVIWRAYKHLS
jgi:uncharacterized membrane protein YeaQ/YmgE (transglycosylase-associated protein family)